MSGVEGVNSVQWPAYDVGVTAEKPVRRLMLVHAHPDDETIGNGATMAKYVSEGAAVTLVTARSVRKVRCWSRISLTSPPNTVTSWASTDSASSRPRWTSSGSPTSSGSAATAGFRDSGMAYSEKGDAVPRDVLREEIFWTTDLLEAADALVPLIRDRHGGRDRTDHVHGEDQRREAVKSPTTSSNPPMSSTTPTM